MPDDTLSKFLRLKRQKEEAEREAARAEGVLSRLLDELKEKHQCDNEKEGQEKLKRLEKGLTRLEKEFQDAEQEFYRRWSERLGR